MTEELTGRPSQPVRCSTPSTRMRSRPFETPKPLLGYLGLKFTTPKPSLTPLYRRLPAKTTRTAASASNVGRPVSVCEASNHSSPTLTVMDTAWGSGDPTPHLDIANHVVFDDHGCKLTLRLDRARRSSALCLIDAQWIAREQTRASYLDYLCTTTRASR